MRATIGQTLEQARRMGAPRATALCQSIGGSVDFQTGRWDDAEERLREAVELFETVKSPSGQSMTLQKLALVLTAKGEVEEAQALLYEGLALAERAAMQSHCETRIQATLLRNRIAADDLEGVREQLEEGMAASRRHGSCMTCSALLLPELVRGFVLTGELEQARRHADQLEATAARFGSRAWSATARHARARVLQASGEHDDALAAFEEAEATFRDIEHVYDAARCLMGEVATLRARGGPGDAAAAEVKAARAEAELRALGTRCVEA